MDPLWLKEKRLVIIGGTTGIGLSAALAFVKQGAKVVVVGIDRQGADSASLQLNDEGIVEVGDATQPETAANAIRTCQKKFGGFDGLYHVAGGSGRKFGDGPLHELTLDGWNQTLALNLTSLMLSNQAAVKAFLVQKTPGTILNMGSVLGFSPSPHHFSTHAYTASKSAVIGFSKSIAAYYAKNNIRINVLAPGLVETPMSQRAAKDEDILDFVRSKQPLDGGRIGIPGDLDGAAIYFMSDYSKFATGQVLAVDGGWSVTEGATNSLTMQSFAIGIDLGCTNIKGVLIDTEGNLLAEAKQETNEHDDAHWKKAVADMIRDFVKKAGNKTRAIGLSAPGLADPKNQCIAFMPGRIPGLENFMWSEWIGEKVWVVNDAHAAMMAESRFGAARGMKHAIVLTLGTGVGGGILIDGQLYQGLAQMAGHFGHTVVDADSPSIDVTNMPGSLECAIGNVTLPERSMGKYHSTEALVTDYRNGDPFATWVWLSSVRKLAISIASAINVTSPEAVILSGGIVQAKEALMVPLQRFLELYEWRPGGKQTPIHFARFSDAAGAVGAAGFALSKTT